MVNTRTLHIGINYTGTDSELRGCVNDAENLREFMVQTGRVLPGHTSIIEEATGNQIVDAFKQLAAETHAADIDHVFISYSGHGTWVRDKDNEERDHRDECLCPSDYETYGLLSDDELSDLLQLFHPKTTITLLMDCCHSGSCMDLPYRYVSKTTEVVESTDKASHPHVVMISGCRDDQTSADAYDSVRREETGAMTSSLLDVLASDATASEDAFEMVDKMRKLLRSRRMGQVPQLCTSFRVTDGLAYLW